MYTEKQIQEFKKMGYDVELDGNVKTETVLEKKIKRRAAEESESMRIVLTSSDSIYRDRALDRAISSYVRTTTRVKADMTDEDRLELGLVTSQRPGVSYLVLSDDSKVCRCCQKRKMSSFFSNTITAKDGKMAICKSCDNKRGKSYRKFKEES
jgi:hypothetical protein